MNTLRYCFPSTSVMMTELESVGLLDQEDPDEPTHFPRSMRKNGVDMYYLGRLIDHGKTTISVLGIPLYSLRAGVHLDLYTQKQEIPELCSYQVFPQTPMNTF